MATRNELKTLAYTRLKEAKLLHKNKFYDGAIYLCGYVIEMALKARICKLLKVTAYPEDLPNMKIHKFEYLLIQSGLSSEINASVDKALFDNWNFVTPWSSEKRYTPIGTATKKYSEDMIRALEDPTCGIFTWIKKKW